MAGEAADPREREAVLARARRLMAGETSDPQEREAILAQARGLMTGETTDPQEREAILAQARRLLIGEPDVAVTLDPQERAAILAQARGLFTGDAATPEDRDVLLARAKRLLSGTSGDAAGSLDPMDRDALMAQARRLVSGAAAEADNAAADRKAMERLLRSAQAALTEGRLEEAAALYDEVLSLGDDPRALLGAAQVYRRQRRWGEAADVLTRLVVLQPRSVQSKRWLAQALLQDGQLAAAAAAYVDLSILQPDSSDVWQSLGQLQKRLGNWSGARVAWTRLIEIDPAAVGPRFELAWACHQAGDGDAARTQLQEILVRDPEHRPALTLLGRMTSATDPDDSLVCWGKLAALDPAAIEPHLQIARIHLRQQRLERAESSFRAVLDRDSRHAESMASIGRILAERDPEEAVRYFLRWTEQDNEAIGPWLAIAQMRSRARQADLAEAAYRRALEIDPLHQEALMRLGRLLTEGGQQEAALEVWSRLGELSPRQVEPKLQAGRILYARHDPRAEDALRAVLAIDPTNRQALRYLAQSLGRARGTIDAALEVWQQLADLDSDSVFPIAQRGRLFARLGRLADAEAEYRRALARDPHDPMALRDLARFYRVQLRWDDAADIYRTHLRVDPQRMDAILGLGQCLDRTNRLPEAKELYDRALSLEPDNITALGYRGRLLRTRGRVDDAIADFRRICELDPQNAGAWHELIFQLAGAEREPEALSALANAEKALGDGPETWMVLARAAAAALFEDQAIAYFERALAARPDSAEYRAQLGLHYARQGVVDGAFHHLLDSRDLAPRNVEVAKGLFDATRIIATLGLDHVALRRAGRTVGDILVPERLFHHVRRVADTAVEPYEPVPRRIVAISATLAPGGAERQLVNMLRGLSAPAYGLDLNLFCISLTSRLRRDFFLPVLDGTGVEVVSLDSSDVENCLWQPEVAPFAELIRHFPRDMVMPIAFWLQEFRRRRPQVVHAWQDSTNLTAVVAAVLAGVPRIVLCCRSVHPDNPRRRLRRFMNEAYRAVLDHPSVVMSNNSRAGADDYAEWLDMAPERIEVVYNGVDFDRLRSSPEEAEAARRQLGIPGGAPVLGGVFRMSEEKRPLLWLDVAAAVARQDETVHFVICGDGPMRDEMLKHAAALGIADRVHMPGAQSNIGSWYRLMGVVMLTSRHEGLPNVLLEAQSLGIPVVAPDVGGMSEVVEQGITGWTIRDADAESLAERVVHCLSNQDWRRLAVERAPVFVRERFGIPTMLRRNLEVYGIEQEPAVTR